MTLPQWDDRRVARWLGKLDALEAEFQPVSDALFEAAHLVPGMTVPDVRPVRVLLEGHSTAESALAPDALRPALAPRHDGTGIAAAGGFIVVSAL